MEEEEEQTQNDLSKSLKGRARMTIQVCSLYARCYEGRSRNSASVTFNIITERIANVEQNEGEEKTQNGLSESLEARARMNQEEEETQNDLSKSLGGRARMAREGTSEPGEQELRVTLLELRRDLKLVLRSGNRYERPKSFHHRRYYPLRIIRPETPVLLPHLDYITLEELL
ncbi:hypothetical protein QAD02_017032 [Eretmocerus hayati]|uniref:Uncharacterized protein n=1 Tax=Eretmocerus hayati TaxID=131215 RepID=A0ACC2PCU9_9HYME|nr:hypothetical protein QAD02_017032 [Eretmocerus hayati]